MVLSHRATALTTTILVAQDDADAAKFIAFNLEAAGLHAVVAIDGAEALEHVESVAPGLVLLDIPLRRPAGLAWFSIRVLCLGRWRPRPRECLLPY